MVAVKVGPEKTRSLGSLDFVHRFWVIPVDIIPREKYTDQMVAQHQHCPAVGWKEALRGHIGSDTLADVLSAVLWETPLPAALPEIDELDCRRRMLKGNALIS
jgi:hypothetical protein